jgi:hypothetical protein
MAAITGSRCFAICISYVIKENIVPTPRVTAIKLRMNRHSGRDCRTTAWMQEVGQRREQLPNPEARGGKLEYIPVTWISVIPAEMTA